MNNIVDQLQKIEHWAVGLESLDAKEVRSTIKAYEEHMIPYHQQLVASAGLKTLGDKVEHLNYILVQYELAKEILTRKEAKPRQFTIVVEAGSEEEAASIMELMTDTEKLFIRL